MCIQTNIHSKEKNNNLAQWKLVIQSFVSHYPRNCWCPLHHLHNTPDRAQRECSLYILKAHRAVLSKVLIIIINESLRF